MSIKLCNMKQNESSCSNCNCNCNCNNNRLVTIIGTGNYGTALGKRLVNFGFNVVYGSRKPDLAYIKQNFLNDRNYIQLKTLEDAWVCPTNIIFFAVQPNAYDSVVMQIMKNVSKLEHKVVIDVSNRIFKKEKNVNSNDDISNAEYLQSCFNSFTDKISVVKAFNNISAYSMNCEYSSKSSMKISYGNNEMVPVVGDNLTAVEQIISLGNQMGFRAFQTGSLNKARKLEEMNETVFYEWRYPTIFTAAFLLFNLIWYFFYSYFSNAKYKDFNAYLKAFSLLAYLNRVFAFTSINLLAYVYLAGLVAIMYQLYNGSKTKRFPSYLDLWLKARKQLGLWSFFFATLHLVISLCILSPGYFSVWYKTANQPNITISNYVTERFKFTFHAELNILSGIVAYTLMSILAICSINSIGLSLNWSEWTFIQSKCGILCLTFSLIHDLVMYSRFIIEKDIHKYTNKHILTRVKLFIIWLPLLVLILRFLFSCCKPLRKRIEDIRSGVYEKYKNDENENTSFIVQI